MADELENEIEETLSKQGEEAEADADIEMMVTEIVEADTGANAGENGAEEAVSEDVEVEDVTPARVTFLDYLKSPIIELAIGHDDSVTVLTAHESLLVQSPFFKEACSRFSENATQRRIEMPNEYLDAIGCFLEYIYTGEYFPQRVDGTRGLVRDPSMPDVDPNGEQLLKHARVYTLADKLGMVALKALAHSKIHCVNSSAKGEIAYARYVYASTPMDDATIRKPVASFWAQRSHVLRKEAEDEFRQMCLEFPQFGFDVLTRVLDEKARREGEKPSSGVQSSSRKRQRQSQI